MTYIDLDEVPLGHLTGLEYQAFKDPSLEEGPSQQAIERNRQHLGAFLQADVVVIGAPVYNISIPSQLKAWIDRLAVAGKTFRHVAGGAEGLLQDKRVHLVITSGNAGQSSESLDHNEAYLRYFFGFLDIKEVSVTRADGLALGPESRKAAIGEALARSAAA